MNRRLVRGSIVALLQVALVASLGVMLLVDRATLPRVWVRTMPVDPEALIRGRYLSLGVELGMPAETPYRLRVPVVLHAESGQLKAETSASRWLVDYWVDPLPGRPGFYRLSPPLAFFIPEGIPDPSRRPAGEELWVEVTVARSGHLRPIRLGVKKDGVLKPL